MYRMRALLPVTLVAALFAVGCAKPPEAEIQAARAVLDSARMAEAADYAPQSLAAAEDAMAALDAELAAQQGKFALFRSYDEASAKAATVATAARQAISDAATGKQTAMNEATDLLGQATAMVQEASGLVARAPTGKGTSADIAALRADLQAAQTTLQEAQAAFDAGKYNEAKAKATAALSGAEQVKSAVQAAIQARRRS
jgi:hypothetical protein